MPLISAKKILQNAADNSYGVPLFNVFELSCWTDLIRAAEEKSAPVIAGFYDGFVETPGARESIDFIRHLAKRSSVPIALMLDHGKSIENCIRALSLGFTDVMFDGSQLSFDENVKQTSTIVHFAHYCGAAVEAELGHVGSGEDYGDLEKIKSAYTDPAAAREFVEKTGADFLAIAIGTAHGVYKGKPVLDIERLKQIKKNVSIPLALHGGTGLSQEQFQTSIRHGIAKVNIATDLCLSSFDEMKKAIQKENSGFFEVKAAMHEGHYSRMCYYFDIFGTSNKQK